MTGKVLLWVVFGLANLIRAVVLPGVVMMWPDRPATPRLVRDLPKEQIPARAGFNDRLRAHFPPGSDEAAMIRAPRDEGFTVWPEVTAARIEWRRLSCRDFWQVSGSAASGHILTTGGCAGSSACKPCAAQGPALYSFRSGSPGLWA